MFPKIIELYEYDCRGLCEFNVRSIQLLLSLLDISIPFRFSSEMEPRGKSNEMLVDLLLKSGATSYLSGTGARSYFEPKPYDDAGVDVKWQDFHHPEYSQLHGDFIAHLSSIDLLLNCGIDESRKIIRGVV